MTSTWLTCREARGARAPPTMVSMLPGPRLMLASISQVPPTSVWQLSGANVRAGADSSRAGWPAIVVGLPGWLASWSVPLPVLVQVTSTPPGRSAVTGE